MCATRTGKPARKPAAGRVASRAKPGTVWDRDVLCVEENVAVVGREQAGRAGIAIEGAKGQDGSGD